MATTPRIEPDLLHRQAQVAALSGLVRGDQIDDLVNVVAPYDLPHVGVGMADEILIGDGVHVVPAVGEDSDGVMRDVLVELDSHEPAGSRWTSCFASHAPYATAARTPSSVNVG